MLKLKHLLSASLRQTNEIVNPSWWMRIILKHFDIEAYTNYTITNLGPCTLSLKHPETHNDRWYLHGNKVSEPFACCGLNELRDIYVHPALNEAAFWDEYWGEYKKKCLIPTMFVLAREKGAYILPNYKWMAKHSILVRTIRNIRYSNHKLEIRIFFHPEGKNILMDAKSKERSLCSFPEWYQS